MDAKVLHVQKPATIVTTIRVTHRMSSLTEKGNRPSWFRFLFPVACQLPRELQVMALQCFGILRALRGAAECIESEPGWPRSDSMRRRSSYGITAEVDGRGRALGGTGERRIGCHRAYARERQSHSAGPKR